MANSESADVQEVRCGECRDGQAILDEASKRGGTITIDPVPTPRHQWGDVAVCPECKSAWLVRKAGT